MPTLPFDAIMIATAALGAYNLFRWFRGVRKFELLAAHPLTGLAALAVLVFFLKGVNGGDGLPAGPFGNVAAALLGLAAFSGLVAPTLEPGSRWRSNLLLAAHVACGLTGIVVAIVWINQL